MNTSLTQLQETIDHLKLEEGKNTTELPSVNIYYFTTKDIQIPESSKPYLYLIVKGMLRVHTISGILDYVPGQYSLSDIDSPLSGQCLTASIDAPFIAVQIEMSIDDVISVMLDIDNKLNEKIFEGQIPQKSMSEFDHNIIDVVTRLLKSMQQTDMLSFLGKHLKQEIIFDIIHGSSGKEFLQSIIRLQDAGKIYCVNSWIKQNYRESFAVEELAKLLNMSISSFHQKFKYAVGMGPLQCQKHLRLTEARRLMLDEDKKVADAAMEVGYESVSQFTRDYSRMFGCSPKNDILQLREQLKNATR